MRRSIIGYFLISLLSFVCLAEEPDMSPEESVRKTTMILLKEAKAKKYLLEKDPVEFHLAVTKVLQPHVDFQGFAKGVMAKYYRLATASQRLAFIDKFKGALAVSYSKALLELDSDSISIKSSESGKRTDRAVVHVELETNSGKVYPVQYSLISVDSRWLLRNLVINGINLGLQYRSQFNSSFRSNKGDIDRVIEQWEFEPAND